MTQVPDAPELAMPIGLPSAGADVETHYTDLASILSAEVSASNVAQIWVADSPQFITLHTMVRAAVRYYPAGSSGPGDASFSTDTMLFKTWLWDYLSLRKSSGAGTLIPTAIQISNVDPTSIAALIREELQTNERYANLTVAERSQIETEFMTGNRHLLVTSGTEVAHSAVDAAPPRPELAGHRRIDLSFIGTDGSTLDPYLYLDIWRLIGGPNVDGHPLLDLISRDITPGAAPVEGGTRVRIRGENFGDSSTVTVGSTAATEVRMADGGRLLFATLPPGSEGTADVTIVTPGQSDRTISPGVRYVTDVVETTRAVTAAFIVHLNELLELARSMTAAGTLTDEARRDLHIDLEFVHRLSYEAIDARAAAGGGVADSPGVVDALTRNVELVSTLLDQVITAIG
jgi:hypothetical protein